MLSGIRANNIRLVDRAPGPRAPGQPEPPARARAGPARRPRRRPRAGRSSSSTSTTASRTPTSWSATCTCRSSARCRSWSRRSPGERSRDLLALQEPKSVYAEAYRAVRTNLLFSSPDNPPRVFVVTSPGQQEGKTVTAVNLAITMALSEQAGAARRRRHAQAPHPQDLRHREHVRPLEPDRGRARRRPRAAERPRCRR